MTSDTATDRPETGTVDMKLEVVTVPLTTTRASTARRRTRR